MASLVRIALFSALALPASLAASATSAVSWGKAGVSFEQYRSDAIECGRYGYDLDVSGTEAAAVFRRASRLIELNEAGTRSAGLATIADSARLVAATRPELRFAQVGELQQRTVNGCLIERGYTPFRLSDEQRSRLRRLQHGSAERHAFLYGLASNPDVLGRQAVTFVLAERTTRP